MIEALEQVQGREGKPLLRQRGVVPSDAEGKKFFKNFCHALKRDVRDDPVCAGGRDRVLLAEASVNAAEEDRSPRMYFSSQGNRFDHARIPIGHQRSHENGCGSSHLLQGLHKELFWNAVSAIRSWNMLKGLRSSRFFS